MHIKILLIVFILLTSCSIQSKFNESTPVSDKAAEAATGNVLWKENLGKQYASGVLVNGLVYMPNDEGVITVIKPGPVFESISKNNIGETMFASPAISNGRIYLRCEKHLFCIGEK